MYLHVCELYFCYISLYQCVNCFTDVVRTCPTVQRTTDENCVDDDECSSDDDCQYERICCSDGCGGRVCSDPLETCEVRLVMQCTQLMSNDM